MARRASFRRRLAIVALVLAAVPAIGLGVALIGINQNALEDTNRELLFAVIDDVGHAIDAELDTATLELGAIERALTRDELPAKQRVAAAGELAAASRVLSAVGFYDDTGARFDAVRKKGDTTPLPDTLITRNPAGRVLGTVVRTGALSYLPVTIPIHLEGATWYAYAPVSLAPLERRLVDLDGERFAGDLDAVFVVDRDRRIVAHANPELGGTTSQIDLLRDLGRAPASQQFLVFRAFGDMVGAVRSLQVVPLAVVAQVPTARAYASIGRMRWTVVIAVGLAVVLAAVAAILLSRRLTAPVGKLVAFSRELAARRFDAPMDVHTGDELETLGASMKDAATELAASEKRIVAEVAIRADLGRYLPSQLVDKIVSRAQSLELGGQRRTLTVLFADVASFTTLTEHESPEVVVTILNQLFTILTEIVFRHGGTIDKFIGDCVMAFWNAPDDQPDHARRALAAATDMLRWLEVGNEGWQARYGITIHLAIGVNTGEAIVGNVGSESRMTYTCIGDSVNVAARLESIARPQQILISRATMTAAADAFDYLPVGSQRLVGRAEPIELFEVSV